MQRSIWTTPFWCRSRVFVVGSGEKYLKRANSIRKIHKTHLKTGFNFPCPKQITNFRLVLQNLPVLAAFRQQNSGWAASRSSLPVVIIVCPPPKLSGWNQLKVKQILVNIIKHTLNYSKHNGQNKNYREINHFSHKITKKKSCLKSQHHFSLFWFVLTFTWELSLAVQCGSKLCRVFTGWRPSFIFSNFHWLKLFLVQKICVMWNFGKFGV